MLQAYIYCIHNHANGKRYIGHAFSLKDRMKTHFDSLQKKKHYNKELQRDYNANGGFYFSVEILEVPKGNFCLTYLCERFWILELRPEYNKQFHLIDQYLLLNGLAYLFNRKLETIEKWIVTGNEKLKHPTAQLAIGRYLKYRREL